MQKNGCHTKNEGRNPKVTGKNTVGNIVNKIYFHWDRKKTTQRPPQSDVCHVFCLESVAVGSAAEGEAGQRDASWPEVHFRWTWVKDEGGWTGWSEWRDGGGFLRESGEILCTVTGRSWFRLMIWRASWVFPADTAHSADQNPTLRSFICCTRQKRQERQTTTQKLKTTLKHITVI